MQLKLLHMVKKKKSEIKKTGKKLTLKDQLSEEKDKYIRLFAEFDNYRKRTAKERIELYSTAGHDIMSSVITIIDDLERCIKSNEYSADHGVSLILKKMKSEMEKKGLKEIEDPIGKKLDTDFHEAITSIPVKQKKQKDKIIDVVEKGYMMGNKVIRFTKVVIGK